jgi:hypothetical protein
MSTWTSRLVGIAVLLTLAACGGGGGGIGMSGPTAVREATVTSDRVVIAGPEGFCVDPTSTRDRGDTGFVLLGNCAAISNSRRAGQPAVPAVLTAAISAAGNTGQIADNLFELDTFFRSDEGRRLLSRSQDAATVTVLDGAIEGDAFFLHASDSSAGPIDGLQDSYWRAYLDLGDRIATLSVLGMEDRALSEAQSIATLRDFIRIVRQANSGPPTAGAVAPLPVQPAQPPANVGPLWDVGLFRRIMG